MWWWSDQSVPKDELQSIGDRLAALFSRLHAIDDSIASITKGIIELVRSGRNDREMDAARYEDLRLAVLDLKEHVLALQPEPLPARVRAPDGRFLKRRKPAPGGA